MSITHITSAAHYEHIFPHLKPFSVFDQEIIDEGRGDCHRTAIGTCLQIDPRTLTNYAECDDWHLTCLRELMGRGWMCYWQPKEKAAMNQSPTGWMVACVPSKNFRGKWHSVVVDADLRLVHDPNWNIHTKRSLVRRASIREILVFVPYDPADGEEEKQCLDKKR